MVTGTDKDCIYSLSLAKPHPLPNGRGSGITRILSWCSLVQEFLGLIIGYYYRSVHTSTTEARRSEEYIPMTLLL